MLKRDIKYEDFDGNEQTDTFFFHLSKAELIELEVEYQGGLSAAIQKIVETEDNKALLNEFKRIVLLSYGQKSEDGKRFIKNDQLREEFQQMPAYSSLFTELAMDSTAAAEFISGIMPRDIAEAVKEESLKANTAEKFGINKDSTEIVVSDEVITADPEGAL